MSVTSLDLMPVVSKAHQEANCEAEWRGVCSRAYYAVYHDVKAFHDDLPSPGSAPAHLKGMHEILHAQLTTPMIPSTDARHVTSKRLGHMSKNMHLNRVKADYKRDLTVSKQEAETSVSLAGTILGLLAGGQPPLPPPKHQPSTGIKVPEETNPPPVGLPRIGSRKPALKVIK